MSESHPTPHEPDASHGAAHPSVGGAGRPASAQDRLDAMDKRDLATVGAGALAFLASLMPYYTYSFGGLGAELNAWHGFFGWFGALCALGGAGVLAAHLFGVALPVPVRLLVLALFALGLFCTLVALVVHPGGGCDADDAFMRGVCDVYDEGHSVGYWLALLSTGAGTALAAMRRSAA